MDGFFLLLLHRLTFRKPMDIEALLTSHGIKPTVNRIIVARALEEAGQPMSLTELANKILTVDISSVFRALVLFRDHHLVHVIDDGDGGVCYELCHSHHDDEDDDQHLHFFCERCKRTYCFHDIPMPAVTLPHDFEVTKVNYVVRGICPHCRLAM